MSKSRVAITASTGLQKIAPAVVLLPAQEAPSLGYRNVLTLGKLGDWTDEIDS